MPKNVEIRRVSAEREINDRGGNVLEQMQCEVRLPVPVEPVRLSARQCDLMEGGLGI